MDVKGKVGQLKQLRYLKDEVETLSHRIARLEWRIERNSQCRWRGRSSEEFGARLVALRKRLVFRRACCMEQLEALYAFIDQIGDSRMRQIMTYRYIYGESWQRVATRIGETDEQYPRRLHNRFLAGVEVPSLEDADDWLRRRQWQKERGMRRGN